uniref:Uncharacterized protein n=1 Tax=Sphaerodactylus townsendi TaxID=933632 RepID=A0ACB8G5J0_9SAUR
MGCRGLCCCCCCCGALNEDNARFVLLAALIVAYMLCGAAVFSALELPRERETQQRWQARLQDFSQRHNLSLADLRELLGDYEGAYVAGVRVHDVRPRWDFPGAFYFVGTVVSTIGEQEFFSSSQSSPSELLIKCFKRVEDFNPVERAFVQLSSIDLRAHFLDYGTCD